MMDVLLWVSAHLFNRVLPKQREALGKLGRTLVAVVDGGIAFEHDPIDEDTWSLFFDD